MTPEAEIVKLKATLKLERWLRTILLVLFIAEAIMTQVFSHQAAEAREQISRANALTDKARYEVHQCLVREVRGTR